MNKQPIHELCNGIPNEDEAKHIPSCDDVMPDGTCRCYVNPTIWWQNGRVCPRSKQSSFNYSKEFTAVKKVNPIKLSKKTAGKRR